MTTIFTAVSFVHSIKLTQTVERKIKFEFDMSPQALKIDVCSQVSITALRVWVSNILRKKIREFAMRQLLGQLKPSDNPVKELSHGCGTDKSPRVIRKYWALSAMNDCRFSERSFWHYFKTLTAFSGCLWQNTRNELLKCEIEFYSVEPVLNSL